MGNARIYKVFARQKPRKKKWKPQNWWISITWTAEMKTNENFKNERKISLPSEWKRNYFRTACVGVDGFFLSFCFSLILSMFFSVLLRYCCLFRLPHLSIQRRRNKTTIASSAKVAKQNYDLQLREHFVKNWMDGKARVALELSTFKWFRIVWAHLFKRVKCVSTIDKKTQEEKEDAKPMCRCEWTNLNHTNGIAPNNNGKRWVCVCVCECAIQSHINIKRTYK